MNAPFNPGIVDWSGENPGIYLRANEDAPWQSLCVFFRVVMSDHGRGVGAVVLGAPDEAAGLAKNNFCIGDNEKLMRYLVSDFVAKFGSFKGKAGLDAMSWIGLDSSTTSAKGREHYVETLKGPGVDLELRWEDLGAGIAADVPVEKSPTGKHQMYSVFQGAARASITVNGKKLAGSVTQRDFHGMRFSTAFLAFSETWITVK